MTAATAAVLLTLVLVIEGLLAEDVILSVNTKKPLAITDEKFLSITLDPGYVFMSNFITNNPERSVNMAKALSPAYVRLAGPKSNSYTFAGGNRTHERDPNFIFTETQWNTLNRWAVNSGLDVVAAVAPQQHSEAGGTATRDAVWDSRNVLALISFSDHMGFNISWQLGYECQTRCDTSGGDLGKDVMKLRNILEAFPRFAGSIIAGPDVVTFKTKLQQLYLQEYLNTAAGGLSAITWHPDFASITVDPIGVSMHHDNLALEKDALYRVIGRYVAKKPLWLAESRTEECKKQFLGALVWTRRLGNSAKLGAQVLMRRPQESNLFEPTPDFWVSVLYKTLVGREVLDTKIATGNRTHLHFYCQCTRPSSKYEKGSLTVFGINLTPAKLAISLRGLKIKTLHKYILSPGFDAENRMFSETVLLNNKTLRLENGKDMPEINPAVATSEKGLSMKLPSGGIGFWVIPDLKVKACEGQEYDNRDKMLLKKLVQRLEDFESTEDITNEDTEYLETGDNSDGRRPLIKLLRRWERRGRYSAEDEEVTRYEKLKVLKNLEKLEKLFKREENIEGKRPSALKGKPMFISFEDKQEEINDYTAPEKEIRAKLQMYKRYLEEYKAKRRSPLRPTDRHLSNDNDGFNNERIEDAMRLITKIENTLENLEDLQDSLDPGSDVGLNVTDPEEHFLNALLRTRKQKRSSVPEKIQRRLRAIYDALEEEKIRRQYRHARSIENSMNMASSRIRRNTDKKFGDDPLGLRKTSFYTRRRPRTGEVKEWLLEKLRKKVERSDAGAINIKNRANSNENNFYGFVKREPLPGFPKGDVHFVTGTSSEERNKNYDYVEDTSRDQGKRRKKSKNAEQADHQGIEPWVDYENAEVEYIPQEFLDKSPPGYPKADEKPSKHEELFEAEARAYAPLNGQDEKAEPGTGKILRENPWNETQDKQAKEKVVKQLKKYYNDPAVSQSGEIDIFNPSIDVRSSRASSPEPTGKSQPVAVVEDLGALSIHRPVATSAELASIPRFGQGNQKGSRRFRRDIDSVLEQEMIVQDENNLKDCHCRVIRGLKSTDYEGCELCRRFSERIRGVKAKILAKREKLIRNKERNKRDVVVPQLDDDEYEYEEYDETPEDIKEAVEVAQVVAGVDKVLTRRLADAIEGPETAVEYVHNPANIPPPVQRMVYDYDKRADDHDTYVRPDRDVAAKLAPPPPSPVPATVSATDSPLTEIRRRLINQKNIKKTARTRENHSRRSSDVATVPENSSLKNSEDKSTEAIRPPTVGPTFSEFGLAPHDKIDTKTAALAPVPQSENTPALAETRMGATTTEKSHNPISENSENPQPMRKGVRIFRKAPVKDRIKSLDDAKVREARLIARSKALLAKGDADIKRILKPLESPPKFRAPESAKLQLLYKKQLAELESLKQKLKQKRKTLQESIQLGELGKFSDSTGKIIKRREIMQLLKEEQELQSIVDKGKWDYVMLYKPINYASQLNSGEDVPESKYIPESAEVVRPLHDVQERKIHPVPAMDYQRNSPILMQTDENIGNSETLAPRPIPGDNSYDTIAGSLEYPSAYWEPAFLATSSEFSTEEPERILHDQVTPDTKGNRGNRHSKRLMPKNDEDKSTVDGNKKSKLIPEEVNTATTTPLNENLKNSSISDETKYDSPKYVRLAADKIGLENEKQNNEELREAPNVNEALNSSKYELTLSAPLPNQKRQRGRREISNAIKRSDSENDIWGNAIKLREIERKKLGDDSLDIYTSVDISRIEPATVRPEEVTEEDPLASLIEEAIPKIGDVVTNGLGKAQNVAGSIEKLINEFEETQNEAEYVDEKTQFEEAIKNNPDGLLTHDFFSETTRNIANVFNLLRGIAHALIAN